MSRYDRLKQQSVKAFAETQKVIDHRGDIANEVKRVSDIAYNAGMIISDIDKKFAHATKLSNVDVSFLFLATALQCVRQYILTDFKERVDDKTGAENTGKPKEHSNRTHQWYRPSLDEIITNPVPFDAMFGSPVFDLHIGGGFNHRARTLGHDPVLGWIFGTMNIITSTLTTSDFQSFHIKTGFTVSGAARDKITHKAELSKILHYSKERLLNEGNEGKYAVGYAILKEAVHLKSDIGTHASLPLPVVSTISPDFARTVASYGLDAANALTVGKQISYAVLINSFVAMIHALFYDESICDSRHIYEVRTRKILSYSNLIASASNVLYVAISEDLTKLDIGGILVTLWRLVSDYNFIQKIKLEFLEKEWTQLVMGDDFDF